MTIEDPPRLLVTGGQGFLGRHVVAAWLRRAPTAQVWTIGRSPDRPGHFTHQLGLDPVDGLAPLPEELAALVGRADTHHLEVDVTDAQAVTSVVDDVRPGVIVHAAAALRGEPLASSLATNVVGTSAVALAAAEHPGTRLILISSGSVGAAGTSDDSAGAPGDVGTYVATKSIAEHAVAAVARARGLDAVIARTFNLIGAGAQVRHLPGQLAMQLAGVPPGVRATIHLGNLDARRDLVDVADAATIVVAAALAAPTTLASLPRLHGMPAVDVGTATAPRMRDVVAALVDFAHGDGHVVVDEDQTRAAGAPLLRADPRGADLLDATPATPLATTLQAMLDYATDQSRRIGRRANTSTSGES